MTSPARNTRDLSGRRHGPHDTTTTDAAPAAGTIRHLACATTRGLTAPAAICTVTGGLPAAARLPQILARVAGWPGCQARNGRTGDDHHRPVPGYYRPDPHRPRTRRPARTPPCRHQNITTAALQPAGPG